ncbi:hypothetical protein DNTS_001334 [Danionella cerebrum]|uniref:Uncharacterized protein n=1 Tax=Danionella cerebrum TaxID=2873325 RepID=A0A553Q3T6_9TELE|nr:hypothetical protein DNTS_001334 [Danionella translucida]
MSKKRKRQDDFQKTKLRIGKKKPKADNATNINFKSKAISLPEQLKHGKSGPTTHRRLDLKDLLSQLHHFTSNVKESALVGLRELLSANPTMVELHASVVLSEVAALFTDKDGSVRTAAVRLLRFIAQCVPADRVAPFFPLLSAHLTCAMTHISEAIQEEALRVLDVLLEHYPALLSQRHTVLLGNFLELISQKRKSATGQDKSTKGSYALTINTNRTVTAQQWRLTVLLRLSNFLQAVVEERPLEEGVTSRIGVGMWAGERGLVTPVEVSWEDHVHGKGKIQLFENSGALPNMHSSYRLRPDSKAGTGMNKELYSAEMVQGFAVTLVPLLLEIWVEAAGGERVQTDSVCLLSVESMALMFQILTILQLLRRLTPQRDQQDVLDAWFRNSYLTEFKQQFMKNFPYGLLEVARHKKKADAKRSRPQVPCAASAGNNVEPLAVNVTLCQVMVTFSLRDQDHVAAEDADWLGPIRIFIKDTLTNGSKLSLKHLGALLEVVWRMIVTQRSRAITDDLLQAVFVQYQLKNLAMNIRMLLLRFFSQLYVQEQWNSPHIARSRILAGWLASLPMQLVQLGSRNPQLSAQLLETVQSAAARGHKDLLLSLQKTACSIYDHQEGCVVVLPVESQKRLIQILHFMPEFPAELLACLSQCLDELLSSGLSLFARNGTAGEYPAEGSVALFLTKSALSGCSGTQQEATLKDVDYLSFFFSTLTGCQQVVCHCLDALGCRAQCFDVFQNAIVGNLCGLVVVPDCVCVALLRCVPRLLDVNFLPNETLLHFLSDCCLSMLSLLLQLEQSARKRDAVWEACFAALSSVPKLLRLVLQSFHVSDLCEEELPRFYGGESREQWLSDLLYCYSVTMSSHRANVAMRENLNLF